MRTTEKQELKRKIRNIGIFLLIVFVPTLVVSVCLVNYVPQWLNILVLVVMLFVLFGVYYFVIEKLNAKKQDRISKRKDPFAD